MFSCFTPPVCRIFAWRGKRSPRKTRQNHHLASFRVAIFRPARRKGVSENPPNAEKSLFGPENAKGRHAKTRKSHHLAGFCMATFCVFAPKIRLYDMAQISHHTF